MTNNTCITIDFSGEELIKIGQACVATNLSFSEFIERSIFDAVYETMEEKNEVR